MRGYRRIQENKAYSFYVKSKRYKNHEKFVRPAIVLEGDSYEIVVNRYYFTDATKPSEIEDCIYVDKEITIKYGKVFKQTSIIHNTAWNSTSVAFIWSRWH